MAGPSCCVCRSPQECRCIDSRWPSPSAIRQQQSADQSPGQTFFYPPPPYYMPPVYAQSNSINPPMTPSRPHIDPRLVQYPHPSNFSSFQIHPNTVVFPQDPNDPRTANPPAPTSKRKRATGNVAQPDKGPKKKRLTQCRSTSSNQPVSVDAAATCGIGPSIPPATVTSQSPAMTQLHSATNPHTPFTPASAASSPTTAPSNSLPSTATNVPQSASQTPLNPPPPASHAPEHSHKNFNSNSATDVYFFVRPLKSNAPPEKLPQAETPQLNSAEILMEKPWSKEYSHLGCRLCECVNCRGCSSLN
jgi:hypothetical protein